MRIVFFGTPEFAVESLDILVRNNHQVVAVVTSKDSYGGRGGKQLIESAVKKYAISKGLPVLQPEKLKNNLFLEELKSYNADIFIVVAFRMLPEVIWNMPPLGSYNLHGSLLPKYRGAAPINWAIINGENETGVTSFKLKHQIDTGDVLISARIPIDQDDTAGSLHDKMKILGAKVVLKTIELLIENPNPTFIPQDETKACHAPKIFHDTCEINFQQETQKVYNFIRGLSPYPAAWTTIDGKECKILIASKSESSHSIMDAGSIYTDGKKTLNIKTLDGSIDVLELKMAGQRAMKINEFLAGNKIKDQKVNLSQTN